MRRHHAALCVGSGGVLLHPAVEIDRALGIALLGMGAVALLAMATVVVSAVFFRDAARRRDARKVLRILVEFVRRRD